MKNLVRICTFCIALVLVGLINFTGTAMPGQALEKFDAKSGILIEANSGEVLIEHNSLDRMPIASVTKLTTLLLAFEAIQKGTLSLDKELIASEYASGMGGSQVFIEEGGAYKLENLLHAIIISSANDASVMLAEELCGSEQNFVELMNKRVKELGANNTNYANCTGLPHPNGYSCAHDVALVMREVVKYPLYFEISGIWMEDFTHPRGRVTNMANTNKLLRSFAGCDAGKTGSTGEAGYCMSATAKRQDMRLIAVVLGAENSKQRFDTCATMLNYGYDNFSSKCILSDAVIDTDFVIQKSKNLPNIKPASGYYALLKKGEDVDFLVNYEFYNLAAPQTAGTVVGKAIITKNQIVVQEIDLILQEDVEVMSLWDNVTKIIQNW